MRVIREKLVTFGTMQARDSCIGIVAESNVIYDVMLCR